MQKSCGRLVLRRLKGIRTFSTETSWSCSTEYCTVQFDEVILNQHFWMPHAILTLIHNIGMTAYGRSLCQPLSPTLPVLMVTIFGGEWPPGSTRLRTASACASASEYPHTTTFDQSRRNSVTVIKCANFAPASRNVQCVNKLLFPGTSGVILISRWLAVVSCWRSDWRQ